MQNLRRRLSPKFGIIAFVHAFFPDYGIIWSADATFGQEKYNYFKFLNIQQAQEKKESCFGTIA
ncbi:MULTISPECIES: hypothetical protein [Spirulina sp. CCY15215]|uniref:hypothetical protein n=1 Tax=Spirulina sp. CCY15215 TaxID=2767591 RepID=UPI001951BC2C|nr:hypothetical protein [Spirulina major]